MAMALPFLISSFLIPFVGMFIDKNGKRVKCLIAASGIGIVTYIMFITVTPLIPLISLGII
jgi:MFS-type transporter involved in bile tolerance (Atg22 family)